MTDSEKETKREKEMGMYRDKETESQTWGEMDIISS